jgi:hypothetical protein
MRGARHGTSTVGDGTIVSSPVVSGEPGPAHPLCRADCRATLRFEKKFLLTVHFARRAALDRLQAFDVSRVALPDGSRNS